MSAIWGMIDLSASIDDEIISRMEEPYHSCKIDIYRKYIADNLALGYCGQYFTKEAEYEILPIVDNSEGIYFTADVVLDNREELLSKLRLPEEEAKKIPDGSLMYQIIKNYGKQSFPMFLGTYSFVYCNKEKGEIYLVADAVGSRSLYYCYEHGKLYFSTLINPIIKAIDEKPDWNYRLLSDFLALNNLSMYTEAEETVYKGIYKVAPGQAVIIRDQKLYKEDYWIPEDNKNSKKASSDYKDDFIKLFDSCVSSVLRSSEKTGILLSGGLDSTALACFAAPKLREKGELLYSYTSIPDENYVSEHSPYYITNERKQVERTSEYLGNLKCSFLEMTDRNCFDGALEYMKRYELPYKALQNIRWMHSLSAKAAEDGCKIMLTGQYGNATISSGDMGVYLYTLLRKCRFIELAKEINAFHRENSYSRKAIISNLMRSLLADLKKVRSSDILDEVYISIDLYHKHRIKYRFIKGNHCSTKGHTMIYDTFKKYTANKLAMVQIGEFETHTSLETGVLFRDPSKDRRIIEFCMQLPVNQFVYRGIERRLVREYLSSYLPGEIIKDRKRRGLQSADMVYRLSKEWPEIYKECSELIDHELAGKLLNTQKLKAKLETYRRGLPTNAAFEIMKCLYSILLVKYMIHTGEN